MVGAGSQKLDNLDAGDIELDFDDGQYISYQKSIDFLYIILYYIHVRYISYITSYFHNLSL